MKTRKVLAVNHGAATRGHPTAGDVLPLTRAH